MVAAFARGVIRDLASRYPLDTIMLEAADYRSRAHGGSWVGGHHHERQGTHLRELETALLDVSFNPADMAGAERAGVDAAALRAAFRAHLEAYLAVAPDVPSDLPDSVQAFRRLHPALDEYERSLAGNAARLLQEFRQEAEPHGVRLMGSADPAIDLVMGGAYGPSAGADRRDRPRCPRGTRRRSGADRAAAHGLLRRPAVRHPDS